MRAVSVIGLTAMLGCDAAFDLVAVNTPVIDAALGDANAVTVTFGETGTETYSGVTADTYVELEFPTVNHGVTSLLSCDGAALPRTLLIRFDISAIPPGAQVVSASLFLTTITETPSAVTAAEMLEAWDEGSANGTAGTANWAQRTAGMDWSAPGAAPPSRGTAVLGTILPAVIDMTYEMALEPSVVAGWVADASTNFGLALLVDSNDGVSFRSRNHAQADRRPVLRVTFVPP